MKNLIRILLAIAVLMIWASLFVGAQDLGSRSLLAHYPFTSDASDATANFADAQLINAPIQGAEGVYSNGNYIGSDPDSCFVSTPNITSIDTADLAIAIEFKISEYPSISEPVIIGGSSWRWIGAEIGNTGLLGLVYNGIGTASTEVVSLNTWHTLVLTYNNQLAEFKLYFNGSEAHSATATLDAPPTERDISNTHGGFGFTFKGNFRNLKVYGPASTSSVNDRDLVTFQLHHNAAQQRIEIQTAERIDDLSYRVYGLEGRSLSEGILPINGKLEIPSTAVGTYIVALYRDEKIVGMKKIVLQ
jgi:hypothetical protein